MDSKNNLNFIGGFAGSMKDQETGLDPIPSGADSQHVSGCTPQLEFEVATSMTLTDESLYLKVYRLPLVKKGLDLITEKVVRSTMRVVIICGS